MSDFQTFEAKFVRGLIPLEEASRYFKIPQEEILGLVDSALESSSMMNGDIGNPYFVLCHLLNKIVERKSFETLKYSYLAKITIDGDKL